MEKPPPLGDFQPTPATVLFGLLYCRLLVFNPLEAWQPSWWWDRMHFLIASPIDLAVVWLTSSQLYLSWRQRKIEPIVGAPFKPRLKAVGLLGLLVIAIVTMINLGLTAATITWLSYGLWLSPDRW